SPLAAEVLREPWPIQGDATRLRQSFDNLLRNAIEAQPNGGDMKVEAKTNGDQLIVDISDRGPGVPPERRSEIFEFGKTSKVGGSGIGFSPGPHHVEDPPRVPLSHKQQTH